MKETLILVTEKKNGAPNVQLCGTQVDLVIAFGAIVTALLEAECSEEMIIGIFVLAFEFHNETLKGEDNGKS